MNPESETSTPPSYSTICYWYPHPQWTSEPIAENHPDLAAAEHSGQRWGCLAGTRRIEVRSPDGALQALWDKETPTTIETSYGTDPDTGEAVTDTTHLRNRWQRLGEESQALGRLEHEQAFNSLRNRQSQ